MTTLRLIDFEIAVPAGVSVSYEPPEERRLIYSLTGPDLAELRAMIESAGTSHGYELHRTDTWSRLERPEQRITVMPIGHARLDLRVDDIASLPRSAVEGREIALGPVRMTLPRATTIDAGRERHDAGSTIWRADWQVSGQSPGELADDVHDSLCRDGLRSNGIWPPPRGGIPMWRVEAGTASRFVRAHISESEGRLALELYVFDNGEPIARVDSSQSRGNGDVR
jgi:hypothetical protein